MFKRKLIPLPPWEAWLALATLLVILLGTYTLANHLIK